MQAHSPGIISRNRNILLIALGTVLILLLPLVAMQFSDDVVWSAGDFIVAGALLFGTGIAFELLARRTSSPVRRAVLGVVLLAALLFVWAQLAVGVFGD